MKQRRNGAGDLKKPSFEIYLGWVIARCLLLGTKLIGASLMSRLGESDLYVSAGLDDA